MGWRITLLGKIEATREEKTLTRFESSRAVALLARLVLFPQRTHPREELIELLWPEVEREVSLVRLRHTLRTLRQPLEAGLPAGSVLIADRIAVRINPNAIQTDVGEFEKAVQQKNFEKARGIYCGELLPGLYDDWILEERYRLEALAEGMPPSPVPGTQPLGGGESEVNLRAERFGGQLRVTLALPPYLTAFFGREAEKEAVSQLLGRARLVTLTGLGGTGKTRLSVEVLRSVAPNYEYSGFVALGECLVAQQIPGRIRDALGLPAVNADPLDQIAFKLADAPALLILDNLEQLVDSGGAELVETLLARLPQLTVLVTSRRALSIPGERLFPLESLPNADALALFLDRVQASRPGFHVTEGNREDVLAVCTGLEGIPLALELAAARIRAFSPSEMRAELQSRFDWLARTGLKGDKDDRHRSLSAALEWSWRLLPTAQQRFLANLSLFRAPFTSAEASGVTDYPDARERLENLMADSLVQSVESEESGETRFAMLETVREFACPRLHGDREARARFRAHYLAHPTRDENMVRAWEYALDDGDGEDAHAFASRYEQDWTGRLGVARALDFLIRTRSLPCDDPKRRLDAALLHAECLLRNSDRQGAMALMAETVAPLEEVGSELLAEALQLQAQIGLYDAPQEVTLALLERSLSLTQTPLLRAQALRTKGCLLCQTPDFDAAEPIFDEAAALYAEDAPGVGRLLNNRGHLARRRRQFEESLRLYTLAVEWATRAGDNILVRNSQSNIPDILACLGRHAEAVEAGLACLKTEEAHGDRHLILNALWNLADAFLGTEEWERAARLRSASAALWVREVRPLSDEDLADVECFRAELSKHLDEQTLARLWAEGEKLTLKEALALART